MMYNSLTVNITDGEIALTQHGETVTIPCNEITLGLFRFIRDDDICLFVEDNRRNKEIDSDEEDDLTYAV